MEVEKNLFWKDRWNAEGRKNSKGCSRSHFYFVGSNCWHLFFMCSLGQQGLGSNFPKILKNNFEPPSTVMKNKMALLEYLLWVAVLQCVLMRSGTLTSLTTLQFTVYYSTLAVSVKTWTCISNSRHCTPELRDQCHTPAQFYIKFKKGHNEMPMENITKNSYPQVLLHEEIQYIHSRFC